MVYVCVCLHVCVSTPKAIGMIWHDLDPISLVKQVLQLLALMGMHLALICIVETNPIRVS